MNKIKTNAKEAIKMYRAAICLVLLTISTILLTGCAVNKASPLTGIIYTDVKAPVSATSNATYSKVGTASAISILGIVALGDASIHTAMANGGITKIHHVDFESGNILGFYAKYTVIVYGD